MIAGANSANAPAMIRIVINLRYVIFTRPPVKIDKYNATSCNGLLTIFKALQPGLSKAGYFITSF